MSNRPSVLIVDEDRARQEAILELVEDSGYDAEAATRALALQGRPFSLVLLGWGAGAPEFASQLRERAEGRTAIVAVTGAGGDARLASLGAGADDHISWPASRQELTGVLRRWVVKDETLDDATVATMRRLRLIEHLYPAFIEVLPAQIAALREALGSGDRSAIRHCAHRLRGSSAQMGAVALARVLEEIEGKATRPDGAIEVSLGDLEALARTTIIALQRELNAVD